MPSPESFHQGKKLLIIKRKSWWLIACLIAVGAVVSYFLWKYLHTSNIKPLKTQTKAISVVSATATIGTQQIFFDELGTVSPENTVTIRSRVDGQLMQVLFHEGQKVKQGELLAIIDPKPFQIQLEQNQAQLARDLAQLANAKLDLVRYQILFKQDSIAKQQLDTQAALVKQYQASTKNDQAQIDNTKIQLGYTHITAPISGQVGFRLVDVGNLIHSSDSKGIAVITQVEPITVVFSLPQNKLPAVLDKIHEGNKLNVILFDSNLKKILAKGQLKTIDNQINIATGTVNLKAEFANHDQALFPNQFVDTRLILNTNPDALLIPTVAVQQGSIGPYVYLIKPDQTVTVRKITTSSINEDEIAVASGLEVGDQVIIAGSDNLREGSHVRVIPSKLIPSP